MREKMKDSTMKPLDELLESLEPFAPEVEVVDWPARSRAKWKAKMQAELEARYGTKPRNTWPRTRLTPEDKAERDYWITKLYRDEGWAVMAVAEALSLHSTTITNAIGPDQLNIRRPDRKMGINHTKALAAEQRRKSVEKLHHNGASVREIAAELGYSLSAIRSDLRTLGLPYEPPSVAFRGMTEAESRQLIGNAVRELGNVATVVLTSKLSVVETPDELEQEWDRQLGDVISAIRKIRKAMKGRQQ